MNHGALAGWSRRGHGRVRGCVCSQRPEMALVYTLLVWSAMAGVTESGGAQGKNWVLTDGVVEEGMVMQW